MSHLERELAEAVRRWDRAGWPRPDAILVAGSGLALEFGLPVVALGSFADWVPFETHAVAGHDLRLELLRSATRHVLVFRGRLHLYQGHTAPEVVFPVRLGALLGAQTLLMTNAAGGIDASLRAGDLRVLRDHLNLTGANPLTGATPESWGARFVDLAGAYDPELRALAHRHARAHGILLEEAVYAGLHGPSYESPAEIRMLRAMGADLVGMSTVLEVIAARQLGVRCLVLSLVANAAAGLPGAPLTHDEVLAAAREARARLLPLLESLLADPALCADDKRAELKRREAD